MAVPALFGTYLSSSILILIALVRQSCFCQNESTKGLASVMNMSVMTPVACLDTSGGCVVQLNLGESRQYMSTPTNNVTYVNQIELVTCHACRISICVSRINCSASNNSTYESRLDRVTVYEPAYNSSNDDVGVFYASLDDLMHRPPPVHPGHPGGQLADDCRWTYTSISSSVVFRWESTGNDKRTDTRVVMIAFNFTSIESKKIYSGDTGQHVTIHSPRFPFRYASNGDSVTYLLRHNVHKGRIVVIFEDWLLSSKICIDIYNCEEVGRCPSIDRRCGSDSRRVVALAQFVNIVFSTAVNSPGSYSTAGGFMATVYFEAPENEHCALPRTDCGSSELGVSARLGRVTFVPPTLDDQEYFDCVWVSRSSSHQKRFVMKLLNMTIISNDFTLAVHDGFTSLAPTLATFWGSATDEFSENICSMRHRHNQSLGAAYKLHTNVTFSSSAFYVRFRGFLRTGDNITFEYNPAFQRTTDASAHWTIFSRSSTMHQTESDDTICCDHSVCVLKRHICYLTNLPSCDQFRSTFNCSDSHSEASTILSMKDVWNRDNNEIDWPLIMPIGFGLCLLWIVILWFIVRMRRVSHVSSVTTAGQVNRPGCYQSQLCHNLSIFQQRNLCNGVQGSRAALHINNSRVSCCICTTVLPSPPSYEEALISSVAVYGQTSLYLDQ